MNYLRPFALDGAPGPDPSWLIAAGEELGCTIRLVRGGGVLPTPEASAHERIAVVFRGTAFLTAGQDQHEGGEGAVLFLPAGVPGAFGGPEGSAWLEIVALEEAPNVDGPAPEARAIPIDPDAFIGTGFGYQGQLDRSKGSRSIRVNAVEVSPGSGSPDWHIHAFAQMYLIREGEMTVEVGRRRRLRAGPNTLVILPEGVVHRNFNASGKMERHSAILVPEPEADAVFDYAVTIHDHEASFMTDLPD